MNSEPGKSTRRVQKAIENSGFDFIVRELPESTRSADDAARAVGCDLAQIVKSLVFKNYDTGEAVLVLVSGRNRVDLDKLEAAGAGRLAKADADFVRIHTGFAIGGVSPLGHLKTLLTYIDQDLLDCKTVWAAAGTPNSVFQLDPGALVALTSGVLCDLAEE